MRAGSITVSLADFSAFLAFIFVRRMPTANFTLRLLEKISRDKLFDLPNK